MKMLIKTCVLLHVVGVISVTNIDINLNRSSSAPLDPNLTKNKFVNSVRANASV